MMHMGWLVCAIAIGFCGAEELKAADAHILAAVQSQATQAATVQPAPVAPLPPMPRQIPSMQPIPNPGDELKATGITASPAPATAPAPTAPSVAIPAIPMLVPVPLPTPMTAAPTAAEPVAAPVAGEPVAAEAPPPPAPGPTPIPNMPIPATAMGSKPADPPPAPVAAAPTVAGPVEIPPLTATAKMADSDGKDLGTIMLTETSRGILIAASLAGLPPGAHAFHIHAVGTCQAPFLSAGAHFNPSGAMHGFGPGGQHAGDMPNIHVGPNGAVTFEVLDAMVTLSPGPNSVLDKDGSAIVIHASADDYATDPAGNAGARIACGVIALPK